MLFLLFKLLVYEVEETLRQFIEYWEMLLSKVAEVPVQVFVRINELEEIKGQFLDKVGKVLDLRVCILAELPKDAKVEALQCLLMNRLPRLRPTATFCSPIIKIWVSNCSRAFLIHLLF
ncbi:hypothetical protein [Elizabethkingia ursingii]|uniref:hypothetical protein n=1 Tax=Elizabethkingia ursingii TaxID=1756150 RepID=UPI0010563330|nr:hypothetical protein [Elizabethkingia ursingii]